MSAVPKPPNEDTDDLFETGTHDPEDTDDGGAVVQMEDDEKIPTASDSSFYDNIVNDVDPGDLEAIVSALYQKIDYDIKARSKRDELYEDGLKRTGLGDDAPGGAQFQGATRVVHPMLTKAAVDFGARAIKELMPAGGPVKDYIPGKPTQARVEKAQRKVAYMNWQCTKQIKELRYEMEQGLTQSPLSGVFYLKAVYDERHTRPSVVCINTDDLILPFAATSSYTAERMTYKDFITQAEYDRRVREGIYIDVDLTPPSLPPDQSKAAAANDKIEGKEADPFNQDGLRLFYEVKLELDIESDDGSLKPYLLTMDYTTKRAVRLIRNWEQSDDKCEAMDWIIEFPFVPWRGAYPIGLTHMIGGLSAAATGVLRALLDSGHISNLPTLMKLKGSNLPGQSLQLEATKVTEIDGGVATDDIRKLIMAIPFNPPSAVLFQLLGFLVTEAADVVKVTMDTLADQNSANMPVGTTLALIEQGLKVLSAIHARLHNAFARFLNVLHRINRMYLTDEEVLDETGELMCYRSDFQGPEDVIPVSDPEIFSDIQRFAQMQLVAQRAQLLPQLYDMRKVEMMILKRSKIPDAEDLLVPAPQTTEMNAVNENVAMVMGRPVMAYPDQDHLAHIQVLLDFMTSPLLGMLPIIAPTYLPSALEHLKGHIAMWYVSYMERAASSAVDGDISEFMQFKNTDTQQEMDKLLAAISANPTMGTKAAANQAFQAIPPIVQQVKQLMNSLQPPGASAQNTPQVAAAQIKAQSDQAKLSQQDKEFQMEQQQKQTQAQGEQQTAQAQIAAENQRSAEQLQSESEMHARNMMAQGAAVQAEQQNSLHTTQISELHDDSRTAATNASKEAINAADNATAIQIADKNARVKNGTGLGKDKP